MKTSSVLKSLALASLAGLLVSTAHAYPNALNAWPTDVGVAGSPNIIITWDGTNAVVTFPNPGAYDSRGGDDTYVGVNNISSNSTLQSLHLTGFDIFGFDGDGAVGYSPNWGPSGPTGYEGPGTAFANYGPGDTWSSGNVLFTEGLGLGAGQSAYFSLENSITAGSGLGVTPVATAPDGGSTFALLGATLIGLGALRRRFGAKA